MQKKNRIDNYLPLWLHWIGQLSYFSRPFMASLV